MVEATVPQESPTEPTGTPVEFPEGVQLEPCSWLECTRGHKYSPQVMLARCGYGTPQGWNGCGAPLLAVRKQQCPTCNEPTAKFRLRIDHTTQVPYPIPLCIPGSKSNMEVVVVEINFQQVAEIEATETAKLAKDPSHSHGKVLLGVEEQKDQTSGKTIEE